MPYTPPTPPDVILNFEGPYTPDSSPNVILNFGEAYPNAANFFLFFPVMGDQSG